MLDELARRIEACILSIDGMERLEPETRMGGANACWDFARVREGCHEGKMTSKNPYPKIVRP